jgi:hypothetical protein
MRNSALKTVNASLAAFTVIVCLEISPMLARGGGGGHFSRGAATLPGGGFHSGGRWKAANHGNNRF